MEAAIAMIADNDLSYIDTYVTCNDLHSSRLVRAAYVPFAFLHPSAYLHYPHSGYDLKKKKLGVAGATSVANALRDNTHLSVLQYVAALVVMEREVFSVAHATVAALACICTSAARCVYYCGASVSALNFNHVHIQA